MARQTYSSTGFSLGNALCGLAATVCVARAAVALLIVFYQVWSKDQAKIKALEKSGGDYLKPERKGFRALRADPQLGTTL